MHTQTFTVNYISISSFNCTEAIWQTNDLTSQSYTEKYGDFGQITLPTATTDIEVTIGSSLFCGEKSYSLDYPYSSTTGSNFLTVDLDAGILQISYFNNKMLGTNPAILKISYQDEPDNDGIEFFINITVQCPDQHTQIVSPFNNTLVMTPTIYYDTTLN